MVIHDNCTLFFHRSDALSNWHPSPFQYKGINFNCVEQFMMFCKAKLFNDEETAQRILASIDPKEQKALGRKVKNFVPETWEQHCNGYVSIACREKFQQNPELMQTLLTTKGKIAEASPYDFRWGIGLSEKDPLASDPKNWKGENRLGVILTDLREVFKKKATVSHNSEPQKRSRMR